jgi:hypothetical protein
MTAREAKNARRTTIQEVYDENYIETETLSDVDGRGGYDGPDVDPSGFFRPGARFDL